jgi:hypothetical protein
MSGSRPSTAGRAPSSSPSGNVIILNINEEYSDGDRSKWPTVTADKYHYHDGEHYLFKLAAKWIDKDAVVKGQSGAVSFPPFLPRCRSLRCFKVVLEWYLSLFRVFGIYLELISGGIICSSRQWICYMIEAHMG